MAALSVVTFPCDGHRGVSRSRCLRRVLLWLLSERRLCVLLWNLDFPPRLVEADGRKNLPTCLEEW